MTLMEVTDTGKVVKCYNDIEVHCHKMGPSDTTNGQHKSSGVTDTPSVTAKLPTTVTTCYIVSVVLVYIYLCLFQLNVCVCVTSKLKRNMILSNQSTNELINRINKIIHHQRELWNQLVIESNIQSHQIC